MEERDAQAEIHALRQEIVTQHAENQELLWLRNELAAMREEFVHIRALTYQLIGSANELLLALGMTETHDETGGPGGDRD